MDSATWGSGMRRVLAVAIASVLAACAPAQEEAPAQPTPLTLEQTSYYPAARGLMRPEDGILRADGSVIVMDQAHGLRLIAADGVTTRPFGQFAQAGYVHTPPSVVAGPNGVELEPDGVHALVADVFTGAIWRVNLETEAVERVYQHTHGVNTAVADSTGAIWFTQSSANAPGPTSEARLFEPFNTYAAEGKLYRLAPPNASGARGQAQLIVDGLMFANGIALDEARREIYVAESLGDRVLAFPIDVAAGTLGERRVLANVMTPDNVELGENGTLYVVSPGLSALMTIDRETGATETLFRAQTPETERTVAEWRRRTEAREARIDLFTPPLYAPLPAPITGVILTAEGEPAYISGLGDALIKLER